MAKISVLMLLLATWSSHALARDFSYQAKVEGMVCAFCAYSVNKKISALPGVDADSVDANLEKGSVVFKSSRAVTEETLKSVFSESGFTLSDLSESATRLTANPQPWRLALEINIVGLAAADIEPLLEAVGNLGASRPARIVVHAPADSEPDYLKPMLMGRQQVMKVRYIPLNEKPARLQLYLLPE